MKVAVMFRHAGERGGIAVYTANLLRAILETDRKSEYLLLYRSPEHVGRFSGFPNVIERLVRGPNKLWWDQVAVPRIAAREGADLIFSPKLSVPLRTRCKTILVMHGAEQFAVPHAFELRDRIYFTIANRLYCRRASAIIAPTHLGAEDTARYMGADRKKIHVIHDSYNEQCRVVPQGEAAKARERYGLPDRFVLFVGGLSPLKNLGNVLRAYKILQGVFPHKLVVVGFTRWKYASDLRLVDELGLRDDVLFTGFVPDDDIAAIYSMADALAFPSLYEGFGMPVLEAMACGCPVVTTKTGCSPEVAGDAALLVNPYDPTEIAEAIRRVLSEEPLRTGLIDKGLARAREFSWAKCARETLDLFRSLHNGAT